MQETEKSLYWQPLSSKNFEEVMVRWDKNDPTYARYTQETSALLALFQKSERDVSILDKVKKLNSWYKTRLSNASMEAMSQEIFQQRDKIERLLAIGSDDAVELIRNSCKVPIKKDVYSFATKYCHMKKPDIYPIFDAFVCNILYENNRKLRKVNLRNYSVFRNAINELREKSGIQADLHQFDLYLWIIGKERRQSQKQQLYSSAFQERKRENTKAKIATVSYYPSQDNILHLPQWVPSPTEISAMSRTQKNEVRFNVMKELILHGIKKETLIELLFNLNTGVKKDTIKQDITDSKKGIYCKKLPFLIEEIDGFLRPLKN